MEEPDMKKRNWLSVAAAAQIAVLAGCVPAVMAPTVTATPGPGKLPADLASDNVACVAQTNQQMAATIQAANNQVAGTALQNVLTGTGNNAVAVNAQATNTVQQQYDAAYSTCMYAKGDNVPPYYMQPVAAAEPTEPTHHAKKRVAHKPSTPTGSGSGQASSSGFVVPAPTASPAAGSGFVEPAPTASAAPAAGGGFAVPPPAPH
jgi:hypothetical protein